MFILPVWTRFVVSFHLCVHISFHLCVHVSFHLHGQCVLCIVSPAWTRCVMYHFTCVDNVCSGIICYLYGQGVFMYHFTYVEKVCYVHFTRCVLVSFLLYGQGVFMYHIVYTDKVTAFMYQFTCM